MESKIVQLMPLKDYYVIYEGDNNDYYCHKIQALWLNEDGEVGYLNMMPDGFPDCYPETSTNYLGAWHKSKVPEKYIKWIDKRYETTKT